MRRAAKSQSGVMLIEALIGILIFSIGILALIGMQATAVKNTTDGRYRIEAALLANQVIGQMWVDQANLAKYDKDDGSNYGPRNSWRDNVARMLPGIDVAANTLVPTIDFDPTINEVTVIIQWKAPGTADVHRFQMINRINGAT